MDDNVFLFTCSQAWTHDVAIEAVSKLDRGEWNIVKHEIRDTGIGHESSSSMECINQRSRNSDVRHPALTCYMR